MLGISHLSPNICRTLLLRFPSTSSLPVVHCLYRYPEIAYTHSYFLILKKHFTLPPLPATVFCLYHDISWKICLNVTDFVVTDSADGPLNIFSCPQTHYLILHLLPMTFIGRTANFIPSLPLKH